MERRYFIDHDGIVWTAFKAGHEDWRCFFPGAVWVLLNEATAVLSVLNEDDEVLGEFVAYASLAALALVTGL